MLKFETYWFNPYVSFKTGIKEYQRNKLNFTLLKNKIVHFERSSLRLLKRHLYCNCTFLLISWVLVFHSCCNKLLLIWQLRNLLSYSFVRSEVQHLSHWVEIQMSALLPGSSREVLVSLPFPTFRGHPYSQTSDTFFHFQSMYGF